MGNEERGNRYWWKEEGMCRICKKEKETLEHLMKRCEENIKTDMMIEKVLAEHGRGEKCRLHA